MIHSNLATAHEPQPGKILASIGPYFFQTPRNDQRMSLANFSMGGGLIVEGDVDSNGGVEIGMIYLNKQYTLHRDDKFLTEQIKRMQISTGYRHWFTKVISFGGCFNSAYSMGDAKIVQTNFELDEQDKGTTARLVTEYGFDFSLQVELFELLGQALVLDNRYSLSFSEKRREDSEVVAFFIGVKHAVNR